ncbi:hypothetical protein [Wolbachia endosymbiont of Phyllotreta cruciferae]|nr:hypothetical protein [Wolbachia endosymbiont of Phyllotreta cruciferae]
MKSLLPPNATKQEKELVETIDYKVNPLLLPTNINVCCIALNGITFA